MSNPVLNTLFLEEDTTEQKTCPEELKSQISNILLSENLYKESADLLQFASFGDTTCPPVTQTKRAEGTDCVVQTRINALNNCTSQPGRSSLILNYFKRNFTISAQFDRCELAVTELKQLKTDRFYMSRSGSFIRIKETFQQVEDDSISNEIFPPKSLTVSDQVAAHTFPYNSPNLSFSYLSFTYLIL